MKPQQSIKIETTAPAPPNAPSDVRSLIDYSYEELEIYLEDVRTTNQKYKSKNET